MLYNIIIAVIVIICALLTLVILLQNGQGEGLAGMGGGGGLDSGAGLGARRTADLLSKSTSILGGLFMFLCVVANFAIDRQQPDNSILQQGAPLTNDIAAPSATQSAVPTTTLPPTTTQESNDSEN